MRVCLLFVAAAAAFGQSATFEVISIKPSAPIEGTRSFSADRGGPGSNDPERWSCENLSIWNLVMIAFDLRANDLSAPEWIHQPRFDINAKLAHGATKAQFREMMQNMLKDRFGLIHHRQKKEVPGYELVVAKGGPKFKESDPNAPRSDLPSIGIATADRSGATMGEDGFPVIPPGRAGSVTAGDRARLQWVRATLDRVARSLAFDVGKPVVNATGLAGNYDLSVYFVKPLPSAAPPGPGEAALPAAAEPGGPTLFRAVQDQLGLKLESKKVTVELLVIDHVERVPTEN